MHIIITANHQPAALSPLTDNGSTAMLPIAGKPLIEHLLENVATVPHAQMTIVASRGFNSLNQFVGSGERWGLDINFISSRPNEPLNSLKRRHRDLFSGQVLALSADRVYSENLTDVEAIEQFLKSNISDEDTTLAVTQPAQAIVSHKEYLDLNLAVAQGRFSQLKLRGRERALGLTTGFRTRIDARSVRVGQTHAGNHCRVDQSAQLHGTVVLDSSVVIDRNTKLEDTIVMEHTYVGEQLNLKRCIVSGRHIIRVDEGVVVKLADSFMAAPLQKGVYAAHLAGPANQLAGLAAGVLAMPVMATAVLLSLWENPYQPFVKRTWVSNLAPRSGAKYRLYDTFEFNVTNRALRRLPQILDVSLGHLRWFGVSVASASELDARKEPWQMTRDGCPMGIFGPAQIECHTDSAPEERFLNDAAYVPKAGWRTNAKLLKTFCLNFFSARSESLNAENIPTKES